MSKEPMTKILLHFPGKLIAEVDAFMTKAGAGSRAEAVRTLVRRGLDSEKAGKRLSAAELKALEELREVAEQEDLQGAVERAVRVMRGVNGGEDEAPKPERPPAKKSTKLRSFIGF